MLKRIHVDNFRCLCNFELSPPDLLLLVGNNGAGKTSLWEALSGIQDLVVRGHAADTCFPSDSLTGWSKSKTQRFELEAEIEGGRYVYNVEVAHDVERKTVRIAREQLTLAGAVLYRSEKGDVELFGDVPTDKPRTSFPVDPRRSFLSVLEPRNDNKKTVAFRSFVGRLWLLSPNPRTMDAISRDEADWLERDGANLVSWLRAVFLERSEVQSQLNDDLREVLAGFQTFRLEKAGNARELVLSFRAEDVDHPLPFGLLSDGQRILVMLYALLRGIDPHATVLLLDEPENFVAPREIQPWLVQLSQLVRERGCQTIVVSHNPEVISYLAPDGGAVLSRPGGAATRVRPLEIDPESGLRAAEWLARGYGDE